MAQHDYDIGNNDGATVRADLNSVLEAVASLNSGTTAPSVTFSFMWWSDTTTGLLKQRNAANNAWINKGTLASVNGGLASLAVNTFTGTQNLADNVLERAELKDTSERHNSMGNITGAAAFNYQSGQVVMATVTGDVTVSFTSPPNKGTNAGSFTVVLTNGGSQTVTWPASVRWPGGDAPTLTAAGVDILMFMTVDSGATWYGAALSDMQ